MYHMPFTALLTVHQFLEAKALEMLSHSVELNNEPIQIESHLLTETGS